jgi:signal transduction histidine kinase
VPITYFSILPHTIFGEPIIAYPISFIPLAVLPISYGYSILKYQLLPKNVQIARPTIQVLTSSITVAVYMLTMVLISQLVSPRILGEPVFLFLMILILAGLFTPIRSLIKRSLEKALIGGTFDLPWVISSSNKMVTESKSLSILDDQLQTILRKMHFSNAALIVPEKGLLTTLFHFGFSQSNLDLFNIPLDGFLPAHLLDLGQPTWTNQLVHISSDHRLNDSELAFLSSTPPVIIVPLPGRSELRGILILQPEFELEWISDQDLFVLATLSNFLSVALDNAGFLDSINEGAEVHHQGSDESRDQNGGTSNGKESEFQSIARELHDGPIQDLVGFGFELKKLHFPSIEQEGIYEHKLNSIIRELREICTNLRPASLYLGVTTAIQSLVLRFQENYPGIQFHLTLKGDPVEVGGEMNLALYRITQEAMNNVIQHAQAKNLWVSVEAQESQIQILIRDDGNGFVIPESWFRFANDGHFGIMGMSERVQAIDGVFDISSLPGKGTCLRVVAPLTVSFKEEK